MPPRAKIKGVKMFDIKQDIATERAGGFFCEGCLASRPSSEQSNDPRYCLNCYELLKQEADLTPARKNQTWRPVPKRSEALPDVTEVVTKKVDKGIMQDRFMLQRGRPRKEGEVTRMTEWRRRKAKELQGILL